MFGYLKKLLIRVAARLADEQGRPVPAGSRAPAPDPQPAQARSPGHDQRQSGANGHRLPITSGVRLPLQVVVSGLPRELQPRIRHKEIGNQTIGISLETILPQLPRGSVKIPFGQLRQAAPQVFCSENDHDQVLVALPLGEILSRLNPAFIHRRQQKQVEVPEEICSPFDAQSRDKAPCVEGSPAPAAQDQLQAPALKLAPRHSSTGPAAPFTPARNTTISMPAPVPPTAPGLAAGIRTHREAVSQKPIPALPRRAGTPVNDPNALIVSLIAMVDSWPEAVRNEIVQLKLEEAKVALPGEVAERGLKQGRLAFNWKTVRSWIQPAPLPTVSAHDATLLELPLKIVAPLFLARQRAGNQSRQKATVDEAIPNLFFGSPPAATSETAPTPRTGDTNFFAREDSAERARPVDHATKGSPVLQLVAKCATPNEVVSRAAALDNVAGALIALPDGLMVANRLGPDVNADTLAAFLPQIFGKVSQCTNELRMGELNNLNFTVGAVAWKIFRVNGIFFAAFGRAGRPLPTAQLAALAVELDHKQ